MNDTTGKELTFEGSTVRLGTSGYSFDDWKGPFYPPGIRKGDMLDFYARHFDTAEVNSTYYRILPPGVLQRMVEKTPEGFLFCVKLHSSMTHSRDVTEGQWTDYRAMLQPARESGKLGVLLGQFPYSFKPTPRNVDYLLGLREELPDDTLAIEFRFDGWYDQGLLQRLTEAGLGLVSVDLPSLSHLPPRTPIGGRPVGYVRFHGRNAEKWWEGGPLRYDYGYDRTELKSWMPALRWLARQSDTVFLFFNNCHGGQAVRGAEIMRDLLRREAGE